MEKNQTKVKEEIEKAEVVGLMTHVNGDGDAFGSLLGLRNILEMLGKRVVVFSNEPLLKFMSYMAEESRYEPREAYEDIDLLIMTDVSVEKRLTCPEIYKEAKKRGARTIAIDHHAEGDIYNKVDIAYRVTEISSASEMVFWLSEEMDMKLDKVTAEFLLHGIESDTNFLQNPNTVNKTTYTAKSILLNYGARIKKIRTSYQEGSSLNDLKFLGDIVGRAVMNKRLGMISTYITSEDHEKYGVEPGVSSAIASFLDQTKDAKIVLVAEQRTENTVKVSLRSNNSNSNVAKLASYFGGGGHVKAAGFEVEGKIEDFVGKELDTKMENKLN